MAGSFVLELDTTGPAVDIYMPSYSTPESLDEIVVQATEPIAEWQEFYFVDAEGHRQDVIFSHDGDRYVGNVRFNQFPLGIATFYAQVRDEVLNPSPVRTKAINVIQGALMTIDTEQQTRCLNTRYSVRNQNTAVGWRATEAGTEQRNINDGAGARQIEVGAG